MIEKRKNRYKEKIEKLSDYIKLLNDWFLNSDLQNIKNSTNLERLFAIYHSIQLSIEAINDISAMIVKDLNLIPIDNYSNYKKLYKNQIFSKKIMSKLNKLNGLRNRIVHDYNGLIDEIVWDSIEENFPYLQKFKEEIEKWLKTQ